MARYGNTVRYTGDDIRPAAGVTPVKSGSKGIRVDSDTFDTEEGLLVPVHFYDYGLDVYVLDSDLEEVE